MKWNINVNKKSITDILSVNLWFKNEIAMIKKKLYSRNVMRLYKTKYNLQAITIHDNKGLLKTLYCWYNYSFN